jgi:hypothetical protein
MAAEDVAAGAVGTVEASEGDSVEAIMPRQPLQGFKTRTSSQLSVGSEISCYRLIVSLSLPTLNFVVTICFSSTSVKTNNCLCKSRVVCHLSEFCRLFCAPHQFIHVAALSM